MQSSFKCNWFKHPQLTWKYEIQFGFHGENLLFYVIQLQVLVKLSDWMENFNILSHVFFSA